MARKHKLANADLLSVWSMHDYARAHKDYSSLQRFFMEEISPHDLDFIINYIGFPASWLTQLKYDYPKNCQTIMKIIFEYWFPVALMLAAKVDDITPREILANSYYLLNNELNFSRLLDSELRRNFVKSNSKKFELLSMEIVEELCHLYLNIH